ncbi:MAG: nusB [Myxococcales bacterium]|jgi:N utilization substance protein B|nr:nusB [Myxococcales bacterium]
MATTSNTGTVGPRRRAREIALQILHAMDVSPELSADEAMRRTFEHVLDAQGHVEEEDVVHGPAARGATFDRRLVETIVRGFEAHRAAIDEALTTLSRNWRVERMAVVERNIIRLALYELKFHGDEVPVPVPVNVALDEAIELAKRFGTAEGAAFVNGMLDRALTELDLRR